MWFYSHYVYIVIRSQCNSLIHVCNEFDAYMQGCPLHPRGSTEAAYISRSNQNCAVECHKSRGSYSGFTSRLRFTTHSHSQSIPGDMPRPVPDLHQQRQACVTVRWSWRLHSLNPAKNTLIRCWGHIDVKSWIYVKIAADKQCMQKGDPPRSQSTGLSSRKFPLCGMLWIKHENWIIFARHQGKRDRVSNLWSDNACNWRCLLTSSIR